MCAHAATGDERLRLWTRWREIDTKLDAYAALRSSETAVVVLEPRASRLGDLTRELAEVVQDSCLSRASVRRAAPWLSAHPPA